MFTVHGAKRFVECCERKKLRERGALPKEEGDAVREYTAVCEEKFLSSWLREDGREKEERTVKMSDVNEEVRDEKRKREGEKSREQNGEC